MKRKIFEALRSKEEISVAVLYGSFISSDVFRDVDIGIIVSVEIPYEDLPVYEDVLSEELSNVVGFPVDLRVLNYAPPWFRKRALMGEVLLERPYGIAPIVKFVVDRIQEDFKVVIRQAGVG